MSTLELGSLQAILGAGDQPIEPSGLTVVTLIGTYQTAAGNPGSGTLTFTLTAPISNQGTIIPASPITVTLDPTGSFSIDLFATDDQDTIPTGVWYGVTEQLTGMQPRDYFILVSSAATQPVEISTLTPGDTAWL